MEPQIAITLAVLAAVVWALTVLRAGPDLVLMGALTLLLVTGIVEPAQALKGFANEGLMTVAVLFVVASGLTQTGAIAFVGTRMLGQPSSTRSAQARISIPSAVMSAFLNNTPVVAMMLPLIDDWAKKARFSVSQLLMPLSFATILGGMCTLVGTSTTLVVNGLLIQAQGDEGTGLGFFEIGWVGVPALIVGLAYLLTCSKWLLPERKPVMSQLDDPREYTVEMLVETGAAIDGRSVEEAGLRHLPGMFLIEIERRGNVIPAVSSTTRLEGGDRLVFVGVVDSVIDLRKIAGLKPATDQLFKLGGHESQRCLVEAVVSNSCPYLRMTIREARFRTRYNAAVIAVARNGQRIDRKIGDIQLCAGDVLLLESHPAFVDQQRNSRDFFLVSQVEGYKAPRHERAWVARLILILMVGVVGAGILSMMKAAMLAAGLMIISRCTTGADARRSVDWSVLLVIGAGLGIGEAMRESHTAEYLARNLFTAIGSHELLALGLLYGITMIFTNLITAKAAATLFFPIAIETAAILDADFMPFVIAVIVASAASFATPIGYQTNLMVAGPGGYRSTDYLRFGGPLSFLIWLTAMIVIPFAWPFHTP